ncbi:hypothetical protein DL766_003555 [Monosporascus sp. MC13-8B]|uniref:Uncharacterized protein n=1 Tax=Monosporascus cannonballus TaxID=155416 RepID=A0ABY0HC38_9PEZI|nr:hypothetical protein DL762_004403 [Monosporascus cannonballus]RYP33250.1 hypothetical protein DL766_003555 [Monosporascus sp. MC13-8B]
MSIDRHGHQPKRCFHVGPAIGAAIQGSQDLILSFHNITHLPWYLTIPLVALGVNLLFRLPFNIYTHRVQQRRAELTPILQAWTKRIGDDVHRERVPPSRRRADAKARFDKVTKRIWRKFGVQEWKLYGNLLGLPFWLVGIDAIRRLCGGPRGLLGRWVFGPGEAEAPTMVTATTEAAKGGAAADAAIPSSGTASIPAGSVPSTDLSSSTDGVAAAISHVAAEPSLTTGGCLWFPDLTVADPWHILPLALSGILVLNLWPRSAAGRRLLLNMGSDTAAPGGREPASAADGNNLARGARFRAGLQRGLMLVSLMMGPLTMDLPAALHLYWISSSAVSWATGNVLRRLYPVGGFAVEPCKGIELPVIRGKRDEVAEVTKVTKGTPPKKAQR